MKAYLPLAAAAIVAAGLSFSGAHAQSGASGERVSQVIVYGNDPCPQGAGGEIIVCARRPEADRYRIPENLRGTDERGESESWAARAESMEYVGRTGIQSCSPVGPGGWTGCWEQMMRQARGERRANPEGTPAPQPR